MEATILRDGQYKGGMCDEGKGFREGNSEELEKNSILLVRLRLETSQLLKNYLIASWGLEQT